MPEQRLIDAGKLFTEFEKAAWNNNADRDDVAEELLLNAPTVDAVPVVRCKYCKHAKQEKKYLYYCVWHEEIHNPNWYCADGRQKDGEPNG